jgi:CPA1 family monovalent cation:H+ antiporter
MFNGAAFVLIGLQLRSIVSALNDVYSPAQLAVWSLGIAAVVIAARYVWVFATSYVRYAFLPTDMREGPPPPWRNVFVLATAGMRGVVSLAAALALPDTIPHRDLILFIVFVVIVVTLVGQGLLIPVLIRSWNIADPDDALAREIALARVTMAEAVTARMRELEPQIQAPEEWEIYGRIIAECEQRVTHFRAHVDGSADLDLDTTQHEIEARFRREAFDAQRRALHELRGAGTITDEAYRQVEWQVDLAESRLD